MEVFPYLLERSKVIILEIICGTVGFSINVIFQDGVNCLGCVRVSSGKVLEEKVVEMFFRKFAELQIVFAAFEGL